MDWTTVQAVREIEGMPVLDLDDGVLPRAPGGGIYWKGYHIANIWRFEEKLDAVGNLVNIKTVVALNTPSVLQ